jgi:cupin fold WbuC family metalloprotein
VQIQRISDEVYVAEEPTVKIGQQEIDLLKERVLKAPRGRVRICAHQRSDEPLHEMMIALTQSTYIRPHKHRKKSESFHIVEGEVDVVTFDDDGRISEIIYLGQFGSGRSFFYRLSTSVFHTLLIRSKILVIHETTNGPFKKDDAIFAPWAPEESNAVAAKGYMDALANSVAKS